MMCRSHCGIFVCVLILWSPTEIVFAVEEGALVTGIVSFHGTVPVAETLPVTVDAELCGKEVLIQTVQVNEQTLGLRHVVVSVKSVPSSLMSEGALPKRNFVNESCAFVPRVGAAHRGDTLEIHNRDPILHNTHIKVGQRTFLNVAQLAGSQPIPKTLKRTGIHVFRCDKHTFMAGALLVFDHPYFAVTDESGVFHLPRLSAGTYTIVVWHETLGSLEQEITVPSQGTVTMNFDYP